jgi:hypothetical protein
MAKSLFLFFSIALLLSPPLQARDPASDYPPFRADLNPGAFCDIPISDLHPTQFNIGEIEVRRRAQHIAKMADWKLALYMNEHILPVIIGPGGAPYATDKQHFACALALAGYNNVVGHIVKNLHDLDPADFWKQMKSANWVYLYDKGVGPKDVSALPAHLSAMTDDPYRSLSWAVRDAGGFGVDDKVPYYDFRWADFFRSRIKIAPGDAGFEQAVQEGLKLAKSPEAKDLPGYGLKPDKD